MLIASRHLTSDVSSARSAMFIASRHLTSDISSARSAMFIASRHLTSDISSVGAAGFGLLRERNPWTAKQSCRSDGARGIGMARVAINMALLAELGLRRSFCKCSGPMDNTYSQIYIQVVFAVEGRQNLVRPEHKGELQLWRTLLFALPVGRRDQLYPRPGQAPRPEEPARRVSLFSSEIRSTPRREVYFCRSGF